MKIRRYTIVLLAATGCLAGCGSSADEPGATSAADTGASNTDSSPDQGLADSSPEPKKRVALTPIDGSTFVSDAPFVQVSGVTGALPAEVLSRIHLLKADRSDVEISLTPKSEGSYTNITVAPKIGSLAGAYILHVDPLPTDWSWHASQPAKTDGSAETSFTTESAPHANRIASCGSKVIVEYSEKVAPAASGDITIEYADEPKTAGCTLNAPGGSTPVASFSFACSAMDSTRAVMITANSRMGTAGVSAPAVSKRVTFGPPVGECAFGYIR